MPDTLSQQRPDPRTRINPFAELIDMVIDERRPGYSRLSLEVARHHLNSNGVVHGAVTYAIADTGMGAALHATLDAGQICATIEIKMSYFKPIISGRLICETTLLNRGRKVANLDSRVYLDDTLVAIANGNYAIFTPSKRLSV